MRVLHFIPDIGVSNGVMSFIVNYAKAMPDDIVFDVVYFHEKEQTRKADIEALGGKVYKIDRPAPTDLFSKKLDDFFIKHKNEWDILHIHAPHFAVFIAPPAKRCGMEKICVHCHTTEYSLKGSSLRNKALSLYSKYFIDKKFACSKNAGKLWYGNRPFVVINNAIDTKKYKFNPDVRERVRQELDINSDFVIGHIGRTDIPQKNHRFIFEVFSEVIKKKPKSKLVLIGAELTTELEMLSNNLGIDDKISYLGFRNDIPELLQALDVFFFPSTSEGLPVSVVEAQASGLPVVMSDSITEEVIVTDLVTSLSLNLSHNIWANELVRLNTDSRRTTCDEMMISKWDIYCNATELINYYMVR